MNRRTLLQLLSLTPLLHLFRALRKWAEPPADVVNFPDGEQLKPVLGMKGGEDSDLVIDWWPMVQCVVKESDLPTYGFERREYRLVGTIWHLPLTVPGDGKIITSLQIQIFNESWMFTFWNAEPYGPYSSNVMLGNTPEVVTADWLRRLILVLSPPMKGDA